MAIEETRTFKAPLGNYISSAYLGGGQTAAVYKVRRESDGTEWALKLLTAPELATRFFAEVDILTDLHAGPLHPQLFVDGQPLVPQVADYQRDGADRFIVMTLAQGASLDQILRDEGVIPEYPALQIMAQLITIFHVLHQDLRRSYLDFQPRNLFWQRERGRIMVIDWNLLSPKGKADVAGDVLTLGKLLYRMVVGSELPAGSVTRSPGWSAVTFGCQALLRQATRQNAAARYATAAELGADVQRLLIFWQTPVEPLAEALGDVVSDGLGKQEHKDSTRSKALFVQARSIEDVLKGRAAEVPVFQQQFLKDVSARIAEGWKQSNAFEIGLTFLEAKDGQQARDNFETAYAETDDLDEKLRAARWRLVALAAGDGPRFADVRETVMEACRMLVTGRAQETNRLLTEDVVRRGGAYIKLLRDDAQAWIAYAQATNLAAHVTDDAVETYHQAAAAYQKALDWIADLPYKDLFIREWGDLNEKTTKLTARAKVLEDRKQVMADLRSSLSAQTPDKVIKALEEKLAEEPDDPVLLDISLQQARQWMESDETRASARDLLGIALAHAGKQPRTELAAEWRVADGWLAAAEALNAIPLDQSRFEWAFRNIWTTQSPTAKIALPKLLDQTIQEAERTTNPTLADLVSRLGAEFGWPGYSFRVPEVRRKAEQKARDASAILDTQIETKIAQYHQTQDREALKSAATLVQWRLGRLNDNNGYEAQRLKTIAADIDRQIEINEHEGDLSAKMEALKHEMATYVEPEHLPQLATIETEWRNLEERARSAGVHAVANACSQQIQVLSQRRVALQDLEKHLKAAQSLFQTTSWMSQWKNLANARLDMLRQIQSILAETKQTGLAPARIAGLEKQVKEALPDASDRRLDSPPVGKPGIVDELAAANYDLAAKTYFAITGEQPPAVPKAQSVVTKPVASNQPTATNSGATIQPTVGQTPRPGDRTAQPNATALQPSQTNPHTATESGRNQSSAATAGTRARSVMASLDKLRASPWRWLSALLATVVIVGALAILSALRLQAIDQAIHDEMQRTEERLAHGQATAAADAVKAIAMPTANKMIGQAVQTVEAAITKTAARIEAPAPPASTVNPTVSLPATPATKVLENTPVPVSARIAFPKAGERYPVMPWAVEVQAAQWLTGTYRIILDGVEITRTNSLTKDTITWIYRREVIGAFDDFPNLPADTGKQLGLDERRQLPPGPHTLTVTAASNSGSNDQPRVLDAVTFEITSTSIYATANDATERLAWPGAKTTNNYKYVGQGVFANDRVRILGKQTAKDWNTGKRDVTWYLWEAESNRNYPTRRGWHEASHFDLSDGRTEADIPEIAPPAK